MSDLMNSNIDEGENNNEIKNVLRKEGSPNRKHFQIILTPPRRSSDLTGNSDSVDDYNDYGGTASGCVPTLRTSSNRQHSRKKWVCYRRYIFCLFSLSFNFENTFPIELMLNGGFLYLLFVLVLSVLYGAPLIFLEIFLGKYSGKGVTGCWSFCPIAKGVGLCMMVFNFIYLSHQNFVSGRVLYYMSTSLHSNLPWTNCLNVFNDEECLGPQNYTQRSSVSQTAFDQYWFININQMKLVNGTVVDSHDRYPFLKIISFSVFLMIVFIMSFFNWDTMSPIVYIFVIYPVLSFIALIVLGCRFFTDFNIFWGFLFPEQRNFLSVSTVMEALQFVVSSLNLGYGTLITMSSYYTSKRGIVHSVFVMVFMNFVFVVFQSIFYLQSLSYVMRHQYFFRRQMESFRGLNVIFTNVPEVLSLIQRPNLCTFVYYSAILISSLGRIFATMEVLLCGIFDQYPKLLLKDGHKISVFILLFLLQYSFSFFYLNVNGYMFYILMRTYLHNCGIFVVCFLECVSVCYIYGIRKLSSDYETLTEERLSATWKMLFLIVVPVVSAAGVALNIYFQKVVYFYYVSTKIFLKSLDMFGFYGSLIILTPVPLYAVLYLLRSLFVLKQTVKVSLYKAVHAQETWAHLVQK